MSKPAARSGDMHVCPMATPGAPPIPHVAAIVLLPEDLALAVTVGVINADGSYVVEYSEGTVQHLFGFEQVTLELRARCHQQRGQSGTGPTAGAESHCALKKK